MDMHDETFETRWSRLARKLKGLWRGPHDTDLPAIAAAPPTPRKDVPASPDPATVSQR